MTNVSTCETMDNMLKLSDVSVYIFGIILAKE